MEKLWNSNSGRNRRSNKVVMYGRKQPALSFLDNKKQNEFPYEMEKHPKKYLLAESKEGQPGPLGSLFIRAYPWVLSCVGGYI